MRDLLGLQVLVVDDDDDAREITTLMLESAGARVTQASSVAHAADMLADAEVDVVVSDIAMPGTDGTALVPILRAGALATRRRPRLLALTAFASREDRAEALRAGFDAHLAKPVDASTLIAEVARLGERGP